jgi:hypothetical protein
VVALPYVYFEDKPGRRSAAKIAAVSRPGSRFYRGWEAAGAFGVEDLPRVPATDF